MPLKKQQKTQSSTKSTKDTTSSSQTSKKISSKSFFYQSHSVSSVLTPDGSFEQALSYKNDNGKVQGKYTETKDGKQVVNKEFKTQRGLDAVRKIAYK